MSHVIEIYGVRHNNFKLTIKFNLPEGTPKDSLNEYIQACCDGMFQPCCTLSESLITFYRNNDYIAYLEIETKDYGVPQIGIDIIANWIEKMYTHCVGFNIDTMVIHPKANPPANGAVIKWDYINDCPIIQMISH